MLDITAPVSAAAITPLDASYFESSPRASESDPSLVSSIVVVIGLGSFPLSEMLKVLLFFESMLEDLPRLRETSSASSRSSAC